MNSRHSFFLLVFIVFGVLAGLLVGWFWGAAASSVAWMGQLFLNTLSMLVIPLLVSAVISGVTSLGDVRQLGRLSGVTIAYYLVTVAIAVLIAASAAFSTPVSTPVVTLVVEPGRYRFMDFVMYETLTECFARIGTKETETDGFLRKFLAGSAQ